MDTAVIPHPAREARQDQLWVDDGAWVAAAHHPLFIVDSAGIVLVHNAPAERLCATNDGLRLAGGRLAVDSPNRQARLDALIADATDPGCRDRTGWMRIERPSGRPAIALFVSPQRAGSRRARVEAIDPRRPLAPDRRALREVFGLTASEIRVALLIGAGHDIASASQVSQIAEETVRTQLKSIFRKAGVNRQPDLVRALAWLSPPPPIEADNPNG